LLLLQKRQVDSSKHSAPYAEAAPGRRLVGLRYGAMDATGPRALAEVEVDLARQKLIRFEDIEAPDGEN